MAATQLNTTKYSQKMFFFPLLNLQNVKQHVFQLDLYGMYIRARVHVHTTRLQSKQPENCCCFHAIHLHMNTSAIDGTATLSLEISFSFVL